MTQKPYADGKPQDETMPMKLKWKKIRMMNSQVPMPKRTTIIDAETPSTSRAETTNYILDAAGPLSSRAETPSDGADPSFSVLVQDDQLLQSVFEDL